MEGRKEGKGEEENRIGQRKSDLLSPQRNKVKEGKQTKMGREEEGKTKGGERYEEGKTGGRETVSPND